MRSKFQSSPSVSNVNIIQPFGEGVSSCLDGWMYRSIELIPLTPPTPFHHKDKKQIEQTHFHSLVIINSISFASIRCVSWLWVGGRWPENAIKGIPIQSIPGDRSFWFAHSCGRLSPCPAPLINAASWNFYHQLPWRRLPRPRLYYMIGTAIKVIAPPPPFNTWVKTNYT